MLLIFALFTSIMNVIRRIIIIARIWVGRVIFLMLTTLFLLRALLFPWSRVWWRRLWRIRWRQLGSRFTSGSCFLLRFEISVDRVIWLFSSRVVSNRIPKFLLFRFDVSCSNTSLVSNYESLIYLWYANFSLIVSTYPCVGAVLTSMSVGLQIPYRSINLVAVMESIRLPTLSVYMGGCLKDTSFGVWMCMEFVRFICLLEFDSSTILGQILSRLLS